MTDESKIRGLIFHGGGGVGEEINNLMVENKRLRDERSELAADAAKLLIEKTRLLDVLEPIRHHNVDTHEQWGRSDWKILWKAIRQVQKLLEPMH